MKKEGKLFVVRLTVIGILILVLLAMNVQAATTVIIKPSDWEYSCLNSTHRFREAFEYHNGTGYDFNGTKYCQHGCNDISNDCNPIPETKTYYHAIGIIMLIISMYLMYVIIKTNPKGDDGA